MRHFIYYSGTGVTSGKAMSQGNLMQAGRMDIAIHSFIQAVYLSKGFREDVKFHFVLYGMPDPPKHIEITVTEELELSKKDVAKILKKILYKFKEGQKTEVLPNCFVEKKPLLKVISDLMEEDIEVFILDKKGESLREIEIPKNCAFLIGDHAGLPRKESKRLKTMVEPVSVGPHMYFASQVVAVINNELDFRGI